MNPLLKTAKQIGPVYHGTPHVFDQFEHTQGTRTFFGLAQISVASNAFFFTPDKTIARNWAANRRDERKMPLMVLECYITMNNPIDLRTDDWAWEEVGSRPLPLDNLPDTYRQQTTKSPEVQPISLLEALRDYTEGKVNEADWLECGIDIDKLEIVDQSALFLLVDSKPIIDALKFLKYDGIILNEANEPELGGVSYAVFNQNQIKVVKREKVGAATGSNIFWHGSPSGDLRGAANGLHVGTKEAAKQALEARIGAPAEGEWDGTREYGKTLLAGKHTLAKKGIAETGFNCGLPEEDFYPSQREYKAKFSDKSLVLESYKPDLFAVRIVGEMVNSPADPREDFKANSIMRGQITKGKARRGVYYQNVGEDEGSISAVVPNGGFVQRVASKTSADYGNEIYVLINSLPYGYYKKRLGWQWATGLSTQAVEYLNGLDFSGGNYKLIRTLDKTFTHGLAKIGEYSGWNLSRNAEQEQKLQELWTADTIKTGSSVLEGEIEWPFWFEDGFDPKAKEFILNNKSDDAGLECEAESRAWADRLQEAGFDASVHFGNYFQSGHGNDATGHYWVEIGDKTFDPTFGQFQGKPSKQHYACSPNQDELDAIEGAVIAGAQEENMDYNQLRAHRLEQYAPFIALADAQRGAPESAMLRVQYDPLGAGVYSFTVEHCGDLTHRMNQETSIIFGNFGYDNVKDKVEKVLRNLERPYGFEREMQGNLRNNYEALKDEKLKGKSFEEALAAFKQKCQAYADAHAALKVYNRPQELARDAAVALGKWQFYVATNKLNALLSLLGAGPEAWVAAAGAGLPESKTAKAGPHKQCTAMILLPGAAASKMTEAAMQIPDEELGVDGREDEPHITLKYGIADDLDLLGRVIADQKPFNVTLGKTHVFEVSGSSAGQAPIVVEANSSELAPLHDLINKRMSVRKDDFEYKPHVTLAYVKPEVAMKYKGLDWCEGISFQVNGVVLSKKGGVRIPVPFGKPKTASTDAWEQLKQDWRAGITYHGTTMDIAQIIAKDGFRGLEFKEIRDEVLSKYDKTFEELPHKRQKMLGGLDRSYSSEHHLVSTAPGGEVATRWAGSGGEVARQIESYALGTDEAKGSRIGGEPAVVVARIKNFAGSQHAERVERCITGWEKLIAEGSQVKAEGYTKDDAAKDLWQSYINFLCKPEDLEYLGTLVRGNIEKLKKGPFLMSFAKDASWDREEAGLFVDKFKALGIDVQIVGSVAKKGLGRDLDLLIKTPISQEELIAKAESLSTNDGPGVRFISQSLLGPEEAAQAWAKHGKQYYEGWSKILTFTAGAEDTLELWLTDEFEKEATTKQGSHKTPPLSETQYRDPERGEETNAYADIPERVIGVEDLPSLESLSPDLFKSGAAKGAPERWIYHPAYGVFFSTAEEPHTKLIEKKMGKDMSFGGNYDQVQKGYAFFNNALKKVNLQLFKEGEFIEDTVYNTYKERFPDYEIVETDNAMAMNASKTAAGSVYDLDLEDVVAWGGSLSEAQGEWDKIEADCIERVKAEGGDWGKLTEDEQEARKDKVGWEWLGATWEITLNRLQSLKFPLTIYRGLGSVSLKEINKGRYAEKGTGIYWTYDENSAYIHEELAAGNPHIIILRGIVDSPKKVDWIRTGYVNLVAAEEKEINIWPGEEIQITGYKYKGETKWGNPPKNLRTVTAAQNFKPMPFDNWCDANPMYQPDDFNEAEYRYDENVAHFSTVDFPIEIFRAVQVEEGTQPNFEKAGIYWTWVENSADAYFGAGSMWDQGGPHPKTPQTVVLKARVTRPTDVDWDATLLANMLNEEENEITIQTGAELQLLGVDYGQGYKKPAQKMVTAYADGSKNLPMRGQKGIGGQDFPDFEEEPLFEDKVAGASTALLPDEKEAVEDLGLGGGAGRSLPVLERVPMFPEEEEKTKVAKQYGPVYHGTYGEWSDKIQNDQYKIGKFFSSDPLVAQAYGSFVHECYLTINKPFVVDAKGESYSSIPTPKALKGWVAEGMESVDTDNIADFASKHGYDGVIIKNVVELHHQVEADDYIVFKSNQIKVKGIIEPEISPYTANKYHKQELQRRWEEKYNPKAVTTAQRFYHASTDMLEPGTVLVPQHDPSQFLEREAYLEESRPEGHLSRKECVYMGIRPKDVKLWGRYIYEVKPLGPVERNNIGWFEEMFYLDEPEWMEEDDDDSGITKTLERAATNYWTGAPYQGGLGWEYRAPQAEIIRLIPPKVAASRGPKYLYHGTKRENLNDILKNGLQAGLSEQHIEWGAAVYLACDKVTAESYKRGKSGEWVVLQIDTTKLNKDLLRPDDWEFRDVWTAGEVPQSDKVKYGDNWANVPWEVSLKYSCQVAYMGDIPAAAIKAVPSPKAPPDRSAELQYDFLNAHTVEEIADHFKISPEAAAKSKAEGIVKTSAINPKLKAWFDGSKIVDAKGNPRVVYHGSRKTWISSFDLSMEGTGVVHGSKWGGIWFTSNKGNASWFADTPEEKIEARTDDVAVYGNDPYYCAVYDINGEGLFEVGPYPTEEEAEREAIAQAKMYNDRLGEDTNVHACYLKIVNPYETNEVPRDEEFKAARDGGHDGIIAHEVTDGVEVSDVFVVFNPNQIKSADRNLGNYDPNNLSITAAAGLPSFNAWVKKNGGIAKILDMYDVDTAENYGYGLEEPENAADVKRYEKELLKRAQAEFQDRYETLIAEYQSWQFPMDVFRCISLPENPDPAQQHLFPNTPQARYQQALEAIQYKGVGIYWSWDENSAECHWGSGGPSVTLHGVINKDNVDWEGTLYANMFPSLGDDEKEVRLLEGTQFELEEIQYDEKAGWSQPPVRTVTAAAEKPSYYYHATKAENLDSIAKHGLKPSEDTNWGGDLEAQSLGKTFFGPNPRTAMYYAMIVFHDTLETVGSASIPLCLRVRVPEHIEVTKGNPAVPRTEAPVVPGQEFDEAWTTQPIPPENIEVFWHEWKPLTAGHWGEMSVRWREPEDWEIEESAEHGEVEVNGYYEDWEGDIVGDTLSDAVDEVESFAMPKTAGVVKNPLLMK